MEIEDQNTDPLEIVIILLVPASKVPSNSPPLVMLAKGKAWDKNQWLVTSAAWPFHFIVHPSE